MFLAVQFLLFTVHPGGARPEDVKPAESCPKGGVYVLRDPFTSIIMRTGRARDLETRGSQHGRDPRFKDYDFEPVYRTDDYSEQRGLEQVMNNRATSAQGFPPPFNYNQPIGAGNPNYVNYMSSAQQYINNAK